MGSTARAPVSRRARLATSGEAGFTLPELIVSMAILVIVITALTSVLVSASHTQLDADRRFQAQLQDRTALDKLRRQIHGACDVTYTDGTGLAAGQQYAAITVVSGGVGTSCTSGTPTYTTWCTAPSTLTTGDYALYRVSSTTLPRPTCASAGKIEWADYLTTSTPFCLPSSTTPCVVGGLSVLRPAASLPLLHVTLPVNLNGPTSTKDTYKLVDDIALRNGTRS
jgi:prepilin-type N-terminal cleavage/methylation domain-containing protein